MPSRGAAAKRTPERSKTGAANKKSARTSAPAWLGGEPERKPTTIGEAWHGLNRRSKAVLAAVVALLAGWSTIKSTAIDPLWAMYQHRQPAYDRAVLSALRTGVSFGEMQRDLPNDSVSVLRNDVPFTKFGVQAGLARDELFILDSVYVQVFVSDRQTVLGYTVTARNDRAPKSVEVAGRVVGLGTEAVGQASDSVLAIASACGAHTMYYFEVEHTYGPKMFQTWAFGFSDAGSWPQNIPVPTCSDQASAALAPIPTQKGGDEEYLDAMYTATDSFLEQERSYRMSMPINNIAVTASGVDLSPAMISLHPDMLDGIDPDPTSRRKY